MGQAEKRLRLFGIPILSLIMSMIFGWDAWQAGNWNILWVLTKSFIFTYSIWEGNRQIMQYLYRRWPGIESTAKRVSVEIVAVLVYTLSINFLIGFLIEPISIALGVPHEHSFGLMMFSVLIPTTILVSVYESLYFFESWKVDLERKEALARVNVQSQFEALKKQLDPHFLFNCMNTLASLIDLENDDAQKYLGRLSDVYRYVLDTSDRSTVTLEEELKFIQAYVYLNEVRFRENLNVEQDLDRKFYHHRVPALSLQLLIENAIKHNVASREHPLTIRIFHEGDFLTVENNKKQKNTLHHSTKVGLQNIVKRYQLLTNTPVNITENESVFRVQIPLLDPVAS